MAKRKGRISEVATTKEKKGIIPASNHSAVSRPAGHVAPSFDTLPDSAYIRQPQLLEVLPFSSATLWRKIKVGEFVAATKLSERVAAWNVGAVRAWINAQNQAHA